MKPYPCPENNRAVRQQNKDLSSCESGLTLIECLVAIVVIVVSLTVVGPVMLFSVATRVQNQKTEQAIQIAQGEVDKVRRVVEQGGDYAGDLTALSLVETTLADTVLVPAPTTFIDDTATATNVNQAKRFDADGDGDSDFLIQLFRTEGVKVSSNTAGVASTPVVFDVGIRVYDARAENNAGSLRTDDAGLTFTSGEGDRGSRPLAVMYSQISQGDRDASLCHYWEYTGSTPTNLVCN